MTFTFRISDEEPYTFTIEKDENNNLTAFTATDGSIPYECGIHLKETNGQETKCCRPEPIGCVEGPC